MSTTEVHIASSTVSHCATNIRVSTHKYGPDLRDLFNDKATLMLSTGACSVQTYITRAELSDLILALQIARDELDAQATPTDLITDWAAA